VNLGTFKNESKTLPVCMRQMVAGIRGESLIGLKNPIGYRQLQLTPIARGNRNLYCAREVSPIIDNFTG